MRSVTKLCIALRKTNIKLVSWLQCTAKVLREVFAAKEETHL